MDEVKVCRDCKWTFRCGDCKWLKGRRSSVGIECLQPENQKRWNEKEQQKIKANERFTKVVARYKYPSHMACKKFERVRYDD